MPTALPSAELPTQIQQLLEKRRQHVDAIAGIDQTLAGVGAALSGGAAAPLKAPAAAAPVPAVKGKRRGRRTQYAMSAEESILAFVRLNKGSTTAEIKAHYEGEGRGGSSDNVLSKMVKEKKLRREPLKDRRGSRYLAV